MEIIISQNDNQNITIGNNELQNIELNQNENQLLNINNTDNIQDIEIKQNDNQILYINGGGIVIGITDVLVNGVTVVSDGIAYINVPTKTSELINNSGFITSETDPTVPSYIKSISLADINSWNNKQDLLVSGTNIKTINSTSLLGSGNINISGGSEYSAGAGIDITNNVISNTITSYNDLSDTPTIPTLTSQLTNDSDYVTSEDLSEVAFTGSYASLSNTPENLSEFINDAGYIDNTVDDLVNYTDTTTLNTELSSKQDTLVSGTNIKTINNNSLLGSGNISISGGSATDVQINGTSITSNNVANIITESAYNSSTNKIATKNDLPTATSDLVNDSNYAVTNSNNNFSTSQTINGNLDVNGELKINNIKVLSPSTLFENLNGTTGDITLNDSITNYSYLEIYFRGNNGSIDCTRTYTLNPIRVNLITANYYSNAIYIQNEEITINNTSLTRGSQKEICIIAGIYPDLYNTSVYITKVVGYK